MSFDEDDPPPIRRRPPGRPVLSAFITSLLTTVVAFVALTAADRRGLFEFLRPAPPPAEGPVEVPSLVGATADQARELLQARGLLLTLKGERPDPAVAAGRIAAQVPLAGSRAPHGTAIEAFVSSGAGAVAIPALSGRETGRRRRPAARAQAGAGAPPPGAAARRSPPAW